MRIGAVLVTLMLAGCTVESGSFGDITKPVVDPVTRSSNVAANAAADGDAAEGGYQLDSYKQEQEDADAGSQDDGDAVALAEELGADDVEVPDDAVVTPAPSTGPPESYPK